MHVQEAAEAEGKDPLLPPQLARELKVYYGMAPARARARPPASCMATLVCLDFVTESL